MQHIKGGFPHRRNHQRHTKVREAYETGRGRVVLRAKSRIEEDPETGRETIIVTGDPLSAWVRNGLFKKSCDLVNEKKVEGHQRRPR